MQDAHSRIKDSHAKKISILAGPGTGKTTGGLLPRIRRLLEEKHCTAKEILFLTFSRTAANDFISKLEGTEGMSEVGAMTLHSFCFQILHRQNVFSHINRQFDRILLQFEERLLLRDISGEFGDFDQREELLQQYKNGWTKDPSIAIGTPTNENELRFSAAVESWLKHHNVILIDEVIRLAFQYLCSNPHDEYLSRYKHIIIDEYQDLNVVEQKIIDLFGKIADLCVAGDDDQSIYGFRNAFPKGIHLYHANAEEKVEIDTCRRCPAPVLAVANEVISKIDNRAKRPLLCGQDDPGSLSFIQWKDSEQECKGLAQAIALDCLSKKVSPKDVLVLVQSKILGQLIRDELLKLDLPAKSFYQEDPLSGDEAKNAISHLGLVANPNDKVALRHWIGEGKQDAYCQAYEGLRGLGLNDQRSLMQQLQAPTTELEGLFKRFRGLKKRCVDLKIFIDNTKDKKPEELIDVLFPRDNDKLRYIRSAAQKTLPTAKDTKDWWQKILEEMINADLELESGDFVKVMSLHKSKGLTSKHVYIAAAIDGLIPRAKNADSLLINGQGFQDEDRRLLYVAITRSCSELVISSFSELPIIIAKKSKISFDRTDIRGQQIRTKTCPFLSGLSSLPPARKGEEWLRDRI